LIFFRFFLNISIYLHPQNPGTVEKKNLSDFTSTANNEIIPTQNN